MSSLETILYQKIDWIPRNRDKAKATKRGLFWCRCDSNIVAKTGKCEFCGWRANRKKIKNGYLHLRETYGLE